MKYIFFLSVFLCLNSFGDETKKYTEINNTLFLTEVDSWISYIRLVKNEEEIPPYFRLKAPSALNKRILKRYNIAKYDKDLIIQLDKLLSLNELKLGNKILSNPFVVKILHTLDYNYIETKSFVEQTGKIHPRLKPLITSIYNLLGHDKLMKIEFDYYREKYKESHEKNRILSQSADIIQNINFVDGIGINNFREKYFLTFYNRLKTVSIPELREFIRLIKNEKEFLKLNQVLTAFHYSIIFNLRKVDADQQEAKRKLGLDR
jgi:hypothetical protein